jgi:hypothetical protein
MNRVVRDAIVGADLENRKGGKSFDEAANVGVKLLTAIRGNALETRSDADDRSRVDVAPHRTHVPARHLLFSGLISDLLRPARQCTSRL